MALFANDACGQPVPWEHCCPWMYFDGKLFQSKLLKASREKTPLIDLCDGQVSYRKAGWAGKGGAGGHLQLEWNNAHQQVWSFPLSLYWAWMTGFWFRWGTAQCVTERWLSIHVSWAQDVHLVLIIHNNFSLWICLKHWISKYWNFALRGNIGLGSCESPVVTSSSTSPSIALFYVCFLLRLLNAYIL